MTDSETDCFVQNEFCCCCCCCCRVLLQCLFIISGLPAVIVAISLSIASGKDIIQSFVSDKQYELYFFVFYL